MVGHGKRMIDIFIPSVSYGGSVEYAGFNQSKVELG
jgi:hypothetical protein